MAFFIDAQTEAHATQVSGDYGSESMIPLPSGGSIRFAAHPDTVTYVRVCDDDGRELMYWDEDEFAVDFPDTMGAFLGLTKSVAEFQSEAKPVPYTIALSGTEIDVLAELSEAIDDRPDLGDLDRKDRAFWKRSSNIISKIAARAGRGKT